MSDVMTDRALLARALAALGNLLGVADEGSAAHLVLLEAEAEQAANQDRHPDWDRVRARVLAEARAAVEACSQGVARHAAEREASRAFLSLWRALDSALQAAGKAPITYGEACGVRGWSFEGALEHIRALRADAARVECGP